MWFPARDFVNDELHRTQPGSVLVVALFQGFPIWVRHHERGWELPGGKLNPGETPERAAEREVWEESGATIANLTWLFEYKISVDGVSQTKWVYQGHIIDVEARPETSEITDVRVFRPAPAPNVLKGNPVFSRVVQDGVYQIIYDFHKK